ncbi:hypothetical protein D3C74_212840 [compost metagenome]
MRRLFLKLYRYVHFLKLQKNKDIHTFMPRNQGLPAGSPFPGLTDADVHTGLKEHDGIIVVFLSTTCQACIEIFTAIDRLAERWPSKKMLLFIYGDDTEFRQIQRENRIEVPMIPYEQTQFELYKTTIFPYVYVLSYQGIVLAQGTVNAVEKVNEIVNKGIEGIEYTQLTETGGEKV